MTTDLEQRLRDALHEDAERARLVNPHAPPAPDGPLTVEHHRRRGLMWVAVAAAIALLAYVGAVALLDDDQEVETVPPVSEQLPSTVVGGGCPFGIAGDPIVMQDVPAGSRFEALPSQSVAYTTTGAQVVVVSVPAFDRGTNQSWHDEVIELERGPATLWLDGPPGVSVTQGIGRFVQVRYVTGSEGPCSSFSVSVEGGGEAEKRGTAIDFAERVVLPAELDDGVALELADTEWTFVDTSDGPVGSDMVFTADTVSWDTGCARMGASYELDRDDGFLILTNVETLSGTCGPPTTFGMTPHYPIIDAVMGSGRIPITREGGQLHLGEHPDGDYLVLEPLVPSVGVPEEPQALPEPGEQPADPAAAEEQVRTTYLTIADTTIPEEERAQLSERPEVWLAAANAITQTQYWELIQEIREQVDEVVFVSPTRAVLRFQLISEDSIVPRHHTGEALLVDGRWVMAIATSCYLTSLAGVTCDMSL